MIELVRPAPLQLTREDGHRDEVGQEAAPAAASARRRHLGGEVEVTAGGGRVSGPRGPAGDTLVASVGTLAPCAAHLGPQKARLLSFLVNLEAAMTSLEPGPGHCSDRVSPGPSDD